MEISYDQLDRIGRLADTADNFLQYAEGPFANAVPAAIRFDALRVGLTKLREDLKALVVEVGGEDPWGDAATKE
jgi:hypothetical protein